MLEDRTTPTAVVTIVNGSDAYEGVSNGSFTLTRTGDTSSSLMVTVGISGSSTATPGQDYQYITSTVTFASGSATATVPVVVIGSPYNDTNAEANETVILNVMGPGQFYTVGSPSSGKVNIVDNDVASNTYYWLGDPTGQNNQWSRVGNWTLDRIAKSPASTVPSGYRDDVYFDGSVSNLLSVGGGDYSEYKSLHMVNNYSGLLTLNSDMFHTFEQTCGTIDQPSPSTLLVVTEVFTWKGGTLNSTANLATVLLTGSAMTGTIEPTGGGTVNLGSNLTLDNGATVTMGAGTVNISTAGACINLNNLSKLIADPGIPNVASVNVNLNWQQISQINIGPYSWLKVKSGKLDSKLPAKMTGGSLVLEPYTTTSFKGKVDQAANGPSLLQESGATYIAVTAELDMFGSNGIVMSGGLLSIKCGSRPPGYSGYNISGILTLSGANIEFDPAGGQRREFGEFHVFGNVTWSAGTFSYYADAVSTDSDPWIIQGKLDIKNTASVVARALDENDAVVVPPTDRNWYLFTASLGITEAVNTPSLTTNWQYVKDPLNVPKQWWKVTYIGGN